MRISVRLSGLLMCARWTFGVRVLRQSRVVNLMPCMQRTHDFERTNLPALIRGMEKVRVYPENFHVTREIGKTGLKTIVN